MSTLRSFRHAIVAAALLASAPGLRADSPLVINEYNCVADTNLLEADGALFEGFDYGGFRTATASMGPAHAGRFLGNGNNWVEFVVTQDRVDLRGYKFEWDNADPDSGSVEFAQSDLWSNVRAGTIITFIEDGIFTPIFSDNATGPLVNFDTDTSFNPQSNDWWINIDIDDPRYLIQSGMKVDNDNWRGRLLDAQGNVKQDYVGESSPGWGGTGVNSREVVAPQTDPSATSSNADYNDADFSTFGAPNLIDTGKSSFEELDVQDFSGLRGWWNNRRPGDANVDGRVDFADLLALAQNYNGSSRTWFQGDFDGSGIVEFADLLILAQSYGAGTVLDHGIPDSLAADWALAVSLVPEPAALGVLVAVPAFRRRRKV